MLVRAWLVVLLLAPGPSAADGLADVLAEVYVDSPRLEAGRAGLRAVDEELPIARAGRRPTLTSSSYTGAALVESGADGDGFGVARQSLTLRQPVSTGGAVTAGIARAKGSIEAERARLTGLEQAVLLEAVEVFTAVARDQRVAGLARGNEHRLADQLRATEERRRLGDAVETDVALARIRHARAIAERIAAAGRLQEIGAEYQRVVGDPPGNLVMPDPPDGLPATLEDALAAAQATPAYEAARHDLAAAEAAIDIDRAGARSQMALEAAASFVYDPADERSATRSASVGASVTIPLYQGGAVSARVRRSTERWRQQRHGLDDEARRAEATVTAAFTADATAAARIASLHVQAEAAAFAVDGVRAEAKLGTRSVAEVLDAEADLFDAEQALAEGERERVVTGWRLRAATGQLTVAALGLPVQPYDVARRPAEGKGWFGLGGLGPWR